MKRSICFFSINNMAAFENSNYNSSRTSPLSPIQKDLNSGIDKNQKNDLKEGIEKHHNQTIIEPITTFKIYDSCRQRECLGEDELGPILNEDCEILQATSSTISVSVKNLKTDVTIQNKRPSRFKIGYWDIDINYSFIYDLKYRDIKGNVIKTAKGKNNFVKTYTLFGSISEKTNMVSDIFGNFKNNPPFVIVESKAIALNAKIRGTADYPYKIEVSVGLFSIIKLLRMVSLEIESRGFQIPKECGEELPMDPCEIFSELDFPIESFYPPHKKDLIQSNIPNIVAKEQFFTLDSE